MRGVVSVAVARFTEPSGDFSGPVKWGGQASRIVINPSNGFDEFDALAPRGQLLPSQENLQLG